MARTGLLAFWKNYDRKLYLKAAQVADECGYDSFWVPEAWGYDVISLLTEMAVHTKRIRLGTGIVNAFSRSPGNLAMAAATIDEISEGRFILGLGTSGQRVIEGFHAREFKRPLTQVRDVIRVVQTLIAGRPLNESGAQLHEYRKFTLAMTPIRERIPIYVAALKEKSIVSIGELADGWIPAFWPYDRMEDGRAWIAKGAAKAGREPREITCAPFTTVIPMGDEQGKRRAKEIIAFYIAGMGDYYKELLTDFGYGAECERVEALYRNRETRSQAANEVTGAMIDALSIAGEPAYCIAELRRRRDFGIDLPILALPNEAPWPLVEMFIRGLAPSN